jgi:uncharacterized repeat protein (TIGR03943 family)
VNREAQSLLLFVLGGAVVRMSVTDVYLRYVKAGLRPLLLVAGVVLMAAALATVWYEVRRWRTERREPEGCGHAHHEPRVVAWLLLLPLLALILVVPPALGSYAAGRAGTGLQRPPGFAPLRAGDPVRLTLTDYAGRAVYDHGRSLRGRRVELTGFVTPGRGGVPYLTRMVLNCCAADAQPIKVALSGRLPAHVRPDAWLDVVGTYSGRRVKDEINDRPIPFLEVIQVRPVSGPRNRYEV